MSCIATCFSSFIWYKTICGGRQNGINDLNHSVPDFSSNLKNDVRKYKPHQGPLQGIGHYLRGKINVRPPSLCESSLIFFSNFTSFIDDIRSREALLNRAKKLFKVCTV